MLSIVLPMMVKLDPNVASLAKGLVDLRQTWPDFD